MRSSTGQDNEMVFAQETAPVDAAATLLPGWKLLIVDDDTSVHDVTRLALSGFEFDGRGIEFISAYSGVEGRSLLAKNPDTAVALVDVVMEEEHAGLALIRAIREDDKNQMIRLILRTGQPGQAPERAVIRQYDINDYKDKADLSAQKLYSTVLTSLRSYRDLMALDANRTGLKRVIHATGEVFQSRDMTRFVQGVLEQLVAVLFLGRDSILINCASLAVQRHGAHLSVVAATGKFANLMDGKVQAGLPSDLLADVESVLKSKRSMARLDEYWGYFQAHGGRENVVYFRSAQPLSEDDLGLIKLFLQNVSIAYDNNLLHADIEETQREIVFMLGEAIETRSRETGQHVRRVAEYCHLIALGMGLSAREAEVLKIAAPLHDFGKIGIPDAILHKHGKLDADEWVVMRTHAEIGQEMLGRSDREILKAAAILAGQHHEKWDGTGYPLGLKGADIHIFGRIGAVADVFDALSTRRSYKEPWPIEDILNNLRENRGLHFDPGIIDWVFKNVDRMQAVSIAFPDG